MSIFIGTPRMPAPPANVALTIDQQRIIRMACSLLLGYPTPALLAQLPVIRESLQSLPAEISAPLVEFCDQFEATGLRSLEVHYVDTFDQRRRCALGLTFYTHGDTRGRGQALLAFGEILKRAGFEVSGGELPDHLPLVLEFCALDETDTAEELLRSNREGVEVIRAALHALPSVYALILDALVASLPIPDEKTLAAYQKLISQGPPTELVGIGDLTATPFPLSVEEK